MEASENLNGFLMFSLGIEILNWNKCLKNFFNVLDLTFELIKGPIASSLWVVQVGLQLIFSDSDFRMLERSMTIFMSFHFSHTVQIGKFAGES